MIDDRDRTRLLDMIAYAKDAIELLGDRDEQAVTGDKTVRYAVERCVEIVGEAASQVSQSTRDANPDISWSGAIRTRNRFAHGYRGLDVGVMISTVREDLPPLIAQLERLLGGSPS